MTYSDYVIYVDESGDHTLTAINRDYPVFVLDFCILIGFWDKAEFEAVFHKPFAERP